MHFVTILSNNKAITELSRWTVVIRRYVNGGGLMLAVKKKKRITTQQKQTTHSFFKIKIYIINIL